MGLYTKTLEDKVYAYANLTGRVSRVIIDCKSELVPVIDALHRIEEINKIPDQEDWARKVLDGKL